MLYILSGLKFANYSSNQTSEQTQKVKFVIFIICTKYIHLQKPHNKVHGIMLLYSMYKYIVYTKYTTNR